MPAVPARSPTISLRYRQETLASVSPPCQPKIGNDRPHTAVSFAAQDDVCALQVAMDNATKSGLRESGAAAARFRVLPPRRLAARLQAR